MVDFNKQTVPGIADSVATHIEPVTRFDRSHLTQDAPDREIDVDVTLAVDQSVRYEIVDQMGCGRLSGEITNCGAADGYVSRLQAQLYKATQECDAALRSWAAQAPTAYRRILPPAATFLSAPGWSGFEFTCRVCVGHCQVQCHSCAGCGRVDCRDCSGGGTTVCRSCSGSQMCSCSSCGGSGGHMQQVSSSHYDHQAQRNVYTTTLVKQNCGGCGGSGSNRCYSCSGGRVQCSGCSGSGRVTCGPCGGCGRVDCACCAATGIENQIGTISATVNLSETLSFGPVDAALEEIIRSRVPTADLCAYGQVQTIEHHYNSAGLHSVHRLRIDAAYASLQAAGQQFGIYGLGRERKVLDFVNIAAHLLEDDLVRLEGAAGDQLLPAMQRFVESELNVLIAESVTGSQHDAAASVEQQFHNMVDASYVSRAASALRSGCRKLYSGNLMRSALRLVGASTLFALLLFTFGTPRNSIWHITGWTSLSALLWLGIEYLTLRRIRGSFPEQLATRLQALIKQGGTLTRWRLGVTAAVIASAFGCVLLAEKIPLLNQKHLNQTVHVRSINEGGGVTPFTFISHSLAVYDDRSNATYQGQHEIQEAAREWVRMDNAKRDVDYLAMIPHDILRYPACRVPLTVARPPPKSVKRRFGGVLVHCSQSVSKDTPTWDSWVPVLLDTTLAHPMLL